MIIMYYCVVMYFAYNYKLYYIFEDTIMTVYAKRDHKSAKHLLDLMLDFF